MAFPCHSRVGYVQQTGLSLYSGNSLGRGRGGHVRLPAPANACAESSGSLTQAGLPAGMSQRLGASLSQNQRYAHYRPWRSPRIHPSCRRKSLTDQMDIPIGQMMLDSQKSAQVAQQQLANDVQAIDTLQWSNHGNEPASSAGSH